MGEPGHAILGKNSGATEIRHVARDMRVNKNQPIIVRSRLDQLRHQLPDKDGIQGPAEPGQSIIVERQRFVSQMPAQPIDDVKAHAVVLPVDISITDD